MRAALALCAALVLAGGCQINVDASEIEFSCARDGKCPKGFDCVQGMCVNPANQVDDTIDAGASDHPDADQADGGGEISEASCDELFSGAPGYQLCEEQMDRCHFNVQLDGDTCENACAALGSLCLTAFDNDANLCSPLAEDTCQTPRQSEICVCRRGLVE